MKTLIFAILIVTVAAVSLSLFTNTPTPEVQVTECSLSSESIKAGQINPLSISLKSNDVQNSHSIQIQFSSNALVSFLVGSSELAKNSNFWYYTESLDSKAKITNQMNVVSSLEAGVSQITYRVTVTVYSDGNQIFTKNLDLTVQSP